MRYREFAPGADASRLVECYWTLEGTAPGEIQRVVPDGRSEFIVNLAQPFESLQNGEWQRQPRCFLAGQLTGPLLLRAPAAANIMGIRFRPGGAAQLLGIPIQELTDQTVAARCLNLSSLGDVTDLHQAERTILRLERGRPDPIVDEASRLLALAPDVGAAAAALSMSARQLERRFKARVGLSPSRFARIARFQRVFRTVDEGGTGWAAAAAECGYYDQSHLIRDFRDLAGEPPTHLLAGNELARHFLSHFSKTQTALRA